MCRLFPWFGCRVNRSKRWCGGCCCNESEKYCDNRLFVVINERFNHLGYIQNTCELAICDRVIQSNATIVAKVSPKCQEIQLKRY